MEKDLTKQKEFLNDFERILNELNKMSIDERKSFSIDIKENVTERNLKLLQFSDDYNVICDIQESSHINPHIWLGTNSPNPQILASKTLEGGTGWVKYKLPDDVLISHRMHLTQEQCVSLGLRLLKYGLFEEL